MISCSKLIVTNSNVCASYKANYMPKKASKGRVHGSHQDNKFVNFYSN